MENNGLVKVTQSCPNLCNPIDYIVHGILQARIQEWLAFPASRGSSQPRDLTQVSHIAGRFFTAEPPRVKSTVITLIIQLYFYSFMKDLIPLSKKILFHRGTG